MARTDTQMSLAPCNRNASYPRNVSSHDTGPPPRTRKAARAGPEAARGGCRRPLHDLVSNVGNRAFGGAIARTQGAGIMPSGNVHPSVQSKIDSTRGSGSALDAASPTSSRPRSATSRMSASIPTPRRTTSTTPCREGVRHRHRRLLRQGPVQAEHVGRRQADRARARARRPAARRAHQWAADRLESWRRHGERGGAVADKIASG